jgi:hypothetical protein
MSSVDSLACIQWLVRCRVLRCDHRLATGKDCSLEEVAMVLKDGVVLCELLNRLKTHAINQKTVSYRPQTSQVPFVFFIFEVVRVTIAMNREAMLHNIDHRFF